MHPLQRRDSQYISICSYHHKHFGVDLGMEEFTKRIEEISKDFNLTEQIHVPPPKVIKHLSTTRIQTTMESAKEVKAAASCIGNNLPRDMASDFITLLNFVNNHMPEKSRAPSFYWKIAGSDVAQSIKDLIEENKEFGARLRALEGRKEQYKQDFTSPDPVSAPAETTTPEEVLVPVQITISNENTAPEQDFASMEVTTPDQVTAPHEDTAAKQLYTSVNVTICYEDPPRGSSTLSKKP